MTDLDPTSMCSGFFPGGRYHPWIESKQAQDYMLLDFREDFTKKPKQYVGSSLAYFLALILTTDVDYGVPWLYHIVFSHQSDTFEVYDFKLTKQEGPIFLIEH